MVISISNHMQQLGIRRFTDHRLLITDYRLPFTCILIRADPIGSSKGLHGY